jgi:hypothetical protein
MGGKIDVIQASFGAGELAPDVFGRVDLAKYRAGARILRNFFTRTTGGASTRPGTQFIGRCKVTNLLNPPQLIDFIYKTAQAYILEFGAFYMRVIMNPGTPGSQPGYVLEPALALVGVTQANPAVFNVAAHGFATGDQIVVSGATGMTAINSSNGFQLLVTVLDAAHFAATDLDGNVINAAALPAYTGGGTVARVFTLVTPYAAADVATIKYTQDADVMTLVHTLYAPRILTRSQHWAWTLVTVTFQATVQMPASIAVAALNPGAVAIVNDYYYIVTALTDLPIEESVPTAAVFIPNAALNQNTGCNNSVTWTAPASGPVPSRYNVYRSQAVTHGTTSVPTVFGYIGQSTGLSFVDNNFAPDFTTCPPTHINPFLTNFPGAVAYYQSREMYAGSILNPNNLWTSKSGNFFNMDASSPSQDDDAITDTLTAQQVNAIKHLVSMNGLLALTSSGAWQIASGGTATDALTPTSTTAKPQSYIGCNDVRPLTINYDVLYVQARGSRVRDLAYQFYLNIFTGDDKSVLSAHLFDGRMITRWAYADEPFKVIWACRDDGILLGFTFLKEQDVYAWHRHDTNGLFASVASIPEGNEDATYFVVTRIVPGVNAGNPVQYVERMHSRNMGANLARAIPSNVELAWCVDAGLQYGPNVIASGTLTPQSGAAVAGTQSVAFYCLDGAPFTTAMVGSVIRANGGAATITSVTSTQAVVGNIWPWAPFTPFPNDSSLTPLPAVAGNWSVTAPVGSVSGLDHLNGMTVAILADGNVQPSVVVAGGIVTLPAGVTASIITIGLKFQAQLMTMALDLGEPTVQGKRKKVAELNLILQDSRGLKVGPVKLNGDMANIPALVDVKERTSQAYGQPIPLMTGFEHVVPMPLFQKEGVIMLQQDFPLPATVLAIIPRVIIGDDGG